MAEAQNNVAILNPKTWETKTPTGTATAAGSFVVADPQGLQRNALYMASGTVHYLYDHNEDDWTPITSGAFAGTFVAGACGVYLPWSATYTATGGSTTTATVAAASFNLTGVVVGQTIEFLSGTAANIGLQRTITAILNNAGAGTITLTFTAAVTSSVANNDTFQVSSGRFYVLGTGTLASGSFRFWDMGTMAWTTVSITNLPATWATDGRLVSPSRFGVTYDNGTASSGSATTLVLTGRTWTVNQWANYQLRITAGTGMGQRRVITSNTADTITIPTGATLDSSSVFAIEGDDNAIYAIGNGAVTMYKYTVGGNWATISPGTARAAAPVAGLSADFVAKTGGAGWASVSAILDGRYIYSLRGGGAILDRYDIAGNAWLATTGVNYTGSITTFATGDSTFSYGKYIYIAKEGTAAIPQRFYKYDIIGNYITSLGSDWYLGGAALLGNKIWVKNLSSTGLVYWLYCLQSTATVLRRVMLF